MIKIGNYVDDQAKTKCISLYLRILEAHIGMSCIELSAFNHESKQSPKKLLIKPVEWFSAAIIDYSII